MQRALKPVHPGRSLRRDCVEPAGLSVAEAAEAMGVDASELAGVLECRAPITPELAVRIDKTFGGGARAWYRLQAEFEIESAWLEADPVQPGESPKRDNAAEMGTSMPDAAAALRTSEAELRGMLAGDARVPAALAARIDEVFAHPAKSWFLLQAECEIARAVARGDEFECRRLYPLGDPEDELDEFDRGFDRQIGELLSMQRAAEEAGLEETDLGEFRELLRGGRLDAGIMAAAERGRLRFEADMAGEAAPFGATAVAEADPGGYDAGEHETGEHETGEHDAGKHDAGKHEAGKRETGEHERNGQ